mgnify:CR=1 FL=1
MSIQTLVEKIKEKGNPTIAGLDARLEYIPQHISGRNMMLHGETLRAAAESVVAFNCGLIDALCDIVPAVKPQVRQRAPRRCGRRAGRCARRPLRDPDQPDL